MVPVRMPEGLYGVVKELAEARGQSMAEFMRTSARERISRIRLEKIGEDQS